MRNIGNAFVKMGQFQDAITSFEAIMELVPDYQSGDLQIFLQKDSIWPCAISLLETRKK